MSLRRELRQWRSTIPAEELDREIDAAITHVLAHPAWAAARTIATYAALPGEPRLQRMWQAAWSQGRRVVLPITPPRGKPLSWRLHQQDVPLVRGVFGVPIPPDDAPAVPPDEVDLVIVPALTVDPRGYRLGYGGGYYDRTLPTLTRATKVWLGLESQIRDAVPIEDFDVAVDALVTSLGWRPAQR